MQKIYGRDPLSDGVREICSFESGRALTALGESDVRQTIHRGHGAVDVRREVCGVIYDTAAATTIRRG